MSKITLGDFKQAVYGLIEEIDITNTTDYTKDPDLKQKFNSITNTLMLELFTYKKDIQKDVETVVEGQDFFLPDELDNFFQLKIIKGVDYDIVDNLVTFLEDGTATIYYYSYPKQIDNSTTNDYKFNLPREIIDCMKYGVASDLLKNDSSNAYGNVYANRYKELKQELDMRQAVGSIRIEGGIDV